MFRARSLRVSYFFIIIITEKHTGHIPNWIMSTLSIKMPHSLFACNILMIYLVLSELDRTRLTSKLECQEADGSSRATMHRQNFLAVKSSHSGTYSRIN